MSWRTATFGTSRGFGPWVWQGTVIGLCLLLGSEAVFSQQTSRRVQPEQDKNTNQTSTSEFSGVAFRTPRIEIQPDQSMDGSKLIPTSGSSRRGPVNVPAKFETERVQELKPTLSPESGRGIVTNPNVKSLRRNPEGNRVTLSPAMTDAVIPPPPTRVAQSPHQIQSHRPVGPTPGSQRLSQPPIVSPRAIIGAQQIVPTQQMEPRRPVGPTPPEFRPSNTTPIVSSDQAKRSIAENLGTMQFMNANQFLSQNPEFDDPKQYLAKPDRALPPVNAAKVSTAIQKKQEEVEPAENPAPKIVQDETQATTQPTATQNQVTQTPETQDEQALPRKTQRQEGREVGQFADVRAPIPPVPFADIYQNDRNKLLPTDDTRYVYGGNYLNYAQLTGSASVPSGKAWLAPNFHHRPLYFEEPNLERYGNRVPLQLFVSAAHFFVTIPKLPYKMGVAPPYQCVYTYGHERPGDCVPYQIHRMPLDVRGILNQAFWTCVIAIP